MPEPLLTLTSHGLYCAAGDFFVDPWKPVPRAVITHAHSDHARRGCERYLASREGERVLRTRLGPGVTIDALPYGQAIGAHGVRISLHPAGHILGSAQVRIEHRGQVWCVTGDYKTEPDATCTPFELVRCHTFITESTFGLPIYRWRPQQEVFAEINAWWRGNQTAGRTSILLGYALGKSQRLLAGLDPSIGPIYVHGAVEPLNRAYRESGVALPPTQYVNQAPSKFAWHQALVLAVPSALATPWMRRFGHYSAAFASGWMQIRGTRRRRALDRGFVLSDHVDWPSLLAVIRDSGAQRILVTHGYTASVVRYLREHGYDADGLETQFVGEGDEATTEETSTEESPAASATGEDADEGEASE